MINRPNILIILAEKIRYDCLGSSFAKVGHTPYLDWLAGNGVWFEKAFTPIPLLGPAQQVLLTGRRAEHIGLPGFPSDLLGPYRPLAEGTLTFPQLLAQTEYLNAWIGNWSAADRLPTAFGYHEYIPAEARRTEPAVLAAQAGDWIRLHGQQGLPWHLMLSFPDYIDDSVRPDNLTGFSDNPDRLSALAPWHNFADDLADKPRAQQNLRQRISHERRTWQDWSGRAANSIEQAHRLDEAVGALVAALNQLGVLEDTLIVFTAASGSHCGCHGLSGNEYSCYEEIVRVPMLMHWPGRLPAGMRNSELVSNLLDLPVTLLKLLSLDVPETCQGMDLFGEQPAWRSSLMTTHLGISMGYYSQRMLREQRYKLVWNPTDQNELYDLSNDPWEMTNLAAMEPDLMQRMLTDLHREMASVQDPLTEVAVWGES